MNFLKIFISFAALGSIPFAFSNEIFGTHNEVVEAPCNGASGQPHPNGRGFVADTAFVAETAYIGPNAQVCNGSHVLKEASLYGHAKVACDSVIDDYALIYGQAEVCASRVDSYAMVGENARVFEAKVTDHAHIYGDAHVAYGCPRDGYQEINRNVMLTSEAITGELSECFRVVDFR